MKSRPRWVWVVGVAVLVVALGLAALVRWKTDPDRRLGPKPTVAGAECGLGKPPAALLALDGDTGELRWSRLVDDLDAAYPGGLAVADGTVAYFTDSGRIQALSAADGSHRWCARGGVVTAVDDRLFTIDDGETVELDPATGEAAAVAPEELTDLLERAAGPVAIRGDAAPGAVHARLLTATERATGSTLWTGQVPGFEHVTADDLVLLNDQSNDGAADFGQPGGLPDHFSVTAYGSRTGDRVWSVQLPRFGGLFLAGDHAYVKGWDDDVVRAIDPATGRIEWAAHHDNPGRTVRYSETGDMVAVAADEATGDVFVVLVSRRPYRG